VRLQVIIPTSATDLVCTVRVEDGGAIVYLVPIVLSTGVENMTRSNACCGGNGIGLFAVGFCPAAVEVRAQTGGTTAILNDL